MNSAILIIGGIVMLLWIVVAPIYCVVKLAEFKKRNTLGWGVFAIAALAPSFIVVSILPSLAPADERKSYEDKFTRDNNRAGYILAAIISSLLIVIYCFSYASKPIPPALSGAWLHIHFILLSMACSAVLVASIFSFVRLTKNSNFPTVCLVLLNTTTILLFASIISGAVWKQTIFGSPWSWDPKETWSLILLSTSIIVYTYAAIRVPGILSHVVVSTVYLALFVFGVFGASYFIGGLWPAFLVGK